MKKRPKYSKFRIQNGFDRYDWVGNLEEAQANLAVGQVPAPGTGARESGGVHRPTTAIDAEGTKKDPTQLADPSGSALRPAWQKYQWQKWAPEMDKLILDRYRFKDPIKRTYSKGKKAQEIADHINKLFGTTFTREAVIGRYHRIRNHYRDYRRPNSSLPEAVPSETPGTPSLPKLQFLGEKP